MGCVNIDNVIISKIADSLSYGFLIFVELWFIIEFSKLFIKINKKYIHIIYLISIIFSIMSSFLIFEIDLNLQIIAYLFIVLILFLINNKSMKNIFYIIFAYVIILFSQSIRLIMNNIVFVYLHGENHYANITILNLIEPIILVLLYKLFKKHRIKFQNTLIQNDEWNIYTVFACISICYMWIVNYIAWYVNCDNVIRRTIIYILLIVIITIIYLLIYRYLKISMEKSRRLLEAEKLLQVKDFNDKMFKQVIESDRHNRKIRHDMKFHMRSIKGYIKHKDYDQALHHIDEFVGNIDDTFAVLTDNFILNYTLATNALEMRNEGIHVFLWITSDLYSIRTYDITTIIGNLLKNAYEAQKYVDVKKVIVEIKEDEHRQYIKIVNHCNVDKLVCKDGIYRTIKEDEKNHGLGLEIVRDCIHSYGGEMLQFIEEDGFHTCAFIPRDYELEELQKKEMETNKNNLG